MTIRQYAMLKLFDGSTFSVEEALQWHQTTFGSLCRHKWIRYSARSRHFEMTAEGREIFALYRDLSLMRRHPSQIFSVYVRLQERRQAGPGLVHRHAA